MMNYIVAAAINEDQKSFSVSAYQETVSGVTNYNWKISTILAKAKYCYGNSEDPSRNHGLDSGLCLSILCNPDQWTSKLEDGVFSADEANALVAELRAKYEAAGYSDIMKRHRLVDANGKPIADELTVGWSVKPPKTKRGVANLIERFETVTGRDCSKIRAKVGVALLTDSDATAVRYGFKRIPQSRGEVIGWMVEATN